VPADDETNGRVTLAVLQSEMRHQADRQNMQHEELCRAINELRVDVRERTDDHEGRIRRLEGSDRRGNWQDIGAALAGVGAALAAWLGGK